MAEANPTYESQCRHWAEAQSVSFDAHYVEGKGPYGHCVQYIGDAFWGFNNGQGVIVVNKGGVLWSNSHADGICSEADRACHCIVHPPSTPPHCETAALLLGHCDVHRRTRHRSGRHRRLSCGL